MIDLLNKNKAKIMMFLIVIFISFVLMETSVDSINFLDVAMRIRTHPWITIVSLLFLVDVLLIIFSLTNNRIFTYVFFFLSSLGFSIANQQKITLRSEPLFPHDLLEALNIIDLYKMMERSAKIKSALGIVIMITLMIIIINLKYFKDKKNIFSNFYRRLMTFGISIFAFILFLNINSWNSVLYNGIRHAGFVEYRWSPLQTYRENGAIIGFISNFPGKSMEKPIDYSKQKMDALSIEYVEKASEINELRRRENFEDINVVYILSESLANPDKISNIEVSQNPLDYIQNASDKNASGDLLVNAYGGGTANVEFEVLTSLNTEFLLPNMSLPYQNIIAYHKNFPSIVRDITTEDRNSTAAHSYHSKFYQRRKVFRNLGFEMQLFEDDFVYQEPISDNHYISDRSSYNEILRILKGNKPEFIHFITMQNHTAYSDIYDTYPIDIYSDVEGDLETIKYYTEGIRRTDVATRNFIESISKFDEKTIVVLYGDHHPPIYKDYLTEEDAVNKYTTDFFIYSNFTDDKLSQENYTPAYYINNLVYELADVKITPFMAFLDEFNSVIKDVKGNSFLLSNGEYVDYESLSDYEKKLVNKYKLIQYDVIEGQCFFNDMCK